MNLITEYVSRPEIASGLFKFPSSIVGIADTTVNGKACVRSRILTFWPILGQPDEVMLRLYGVGLEENPILLKEKNIFLKYLFAAEALKPVFDGWRMLPYSFDPYPADVIYNDPPQSTEQEKEVAEYFKNIQNSAHHRDYRRRIVWCDFVTQNLSKDFLKNYNECLITDMHYINPENVKRNDKNIWKKWVGWCDKLSLCASLNWANELLFAKCLPRMSKKDMNTMLLPICEDAA